MTSERKMNEKTVENAKKYVEQLFRDRADGHGADHSIRVYRNALKITSSCEGCDVRLVSLAALLHDADDYKLFRTENNANARAFLNSQGVDAATQDRICEIINDVSFSKNRDKPPVSLEAAIVRDADRLDAIGAVGIARTFAYGGEHGRSQEESVKHFYDKLLLLKDMMNTAAARGMAEERHRFMEEFLAELEKETASGEALH